MISQPRPRIPPPKRLLAETIFVTLAEEIISGELAAGTRLRDMELAARMYVSRVPVREALQRLERIGMVEMSAGRFTRVTEVTDDLVEQSLLFAGLQAGLVTRIAVDRMSADDLLLAAALVDRLPPALPDPIASSSAREELYSFLSLKADNPLQHAMMRETSFALRRNLQRTRIDAWALPLLRTNCASLREAILSRRTDTAESLVREQHAILQVNP